MNHKLVVKVIYIQNIKSINELNMGDVVYGNLEIRGLVILKVKMEESRNKIERCIDKIQTIKKENIKN